MSRDDFDLGDFGDFEEPSFPEEEFLPPEEAPAPRAQRNVAFLAVAALLVLLFLLGLGGVATLIIRQNEEALAYTQTVGAIYQTNTAVAMIAQATATAKAWTPTPSPTPTPTETPTPTPTETPTETPTPSETPTPDVAGTETAAALTATAMGSLQAADQTATAAANAALTLTAQPPFDETGTFTAMETANAIASGTFAVGTGTQVAVGVSATPGEETVPPVVTVTAPPGDFTPARPTVTALSGTGFFEDVAAGKASPGSLAVVGFAALGLVGVIVAARRLRVKG